MGSIIGACLGSFVASLCCGACGQCRPSKENRFGKISRLPYLFLIILSGIFAVIMSEYGETELDLTFYSRKLCQTNCSGNGSVYRVSFILFLFFLLHLLIVPFIPDFHWMCFGLKFIIYIICIIIVFVIDDGNNSDNNSDTNEIFNEFADYFARYVSILYLLIQIIIIIDWAWLMNEFTQEKLNQFAMNNDNNSKKSKDDKKEPMNPWVVLRAVVTIVLYIIVIVFISLFYDWFGGDTCHLHNTLISITLIIVVVNGIGAAIAGGGALPVASLMSLYATFLLFSALKSSDDKTCNSSSDGTDLAMWIGIIFALIMLCVASMRADLMEGAFDMTGVCCFKASTMADIDDEDDNDDAGLAVTTTSSPNEHTKMKNNNNNNKQKNVSRMNNDSDDNDSDVENVVELGIIEDDPNTRNKNNKKKKTTNDENNADKEKTTLVSKTVELGDVTSDSQQRQPYAGGTVVTESTSVSPQKKKAMKNNKEKTESELEEKKQIQNSVFFHLILCLTACYMAMLFTDWGTSSDITTLGDVSAWVNIIVQWVSMLLFWQSLVVYYREVRALTQDD